ncbi:MAG: chorismate pyruvate-lyase family protein [Magnetococcus sp. DMHC-6]
METKKIIFEPMQNWQAPEDLFDGFEDGPSGDLRSLLACSTSLTRYLERYWGKPVGIQLENQMVVPQWEENPPVWGVEHQLPVTGEVLLRNAWLTVNGKKKIFAQSQVAIHFLSESVRAGMEQGQIPLGSLFQESDEVVSRHRLQLTKARVSGPFFQGENFALDHIFWCRRSLFAVNGAPWARILEILVFDHDETVC